MYSLYIPISLSSLSSRQRVLLWLIYEINIWWSLGGAEQSVYIHDDFSLYELELREFFEEKSVALLIWL